MADDKPKLTSALEPGRGYHDLGGLPAGPIPLDVTAARPWEKLSVALGAVLNVRGANLMRTDEIRRAREEYGEALYNELGYFEKSIEGMYRILVEKGVLTADEMDARMAAIEKRILEQGR